MLSVSMMLPLNFLPHNAFNKVSACITNINPTLPMSYFSRNIYAQCQWNLLHIKRLNKTCTTEEYVLYLLGGKLVSRLAVFWIHTNTQIWIHDECLMNDLCNPVTYLWGFIVWLKQQPLAFPALAQLFNSCFVVGEDDWGAKWSRAQRSQGATVFWSATNNRANPASGG